MTRPMAKEILAQWIYQERKEVNLSEYGDASGDQTVAEKILRFFENEKDCFKGLDYVQDREDYQRFRCIYEQVESIPANEEE